MLLDSWVFCTWSVWGVSVRGAGVGWGGGGVWGLERDGFRVLGFGLQSNLNNQGANTLVVIDDEYGGHASQPYQRTRADEGAPPV